MIRLTKPSTALDALWDHLYKVRASGAVPIVTIDPSTEVTKEARSAEWRAMRKSHRKNPIGAKKGTRWWYPMARKHNGRPMTCRNFGCHTRLTWQIDIVCSEACRRELKRFCEECLPILRFERSALEFPEDLKTQRQRHPKHAKHPDNVAESAGVAEYYRAATGGVQQKLRMREKTSTR